MDAVTLLRIRPDLRRYLGAFEGCFGRTTTHDGFACYVRRQLREVPRKVVHPQAARPGRRGPLLRFRGIRAGGLLALLPPAEVPHHRLDPVVV